MTDTITSPKNCASFQFLTARKLENLRGERGAGFRLSNLWNTLSELIVILQWNIQEMTRTPFSQRVGMQKFAQQGPSFALHQLREYTSTKRVVNGNKYSTHPPVTAFAPQGVVPATRESSFVLTSVHGNREQ